MHYHFSENDVPRRETLSGQRRPLRKTVRRLAEEAGEKYWFDRYNFMRPAKLAPLPPHRTTINSDGVEVIGGRYHSLGSGMSVTARLPGIDDDVNLATRRNISRSKLMKNGRIKPLTPSERKQSWKEKKAPSPSEIDLKRKLQKEKRKLAEKLRQRKKRMEKGKIDEEEKLMGSNSLN